MEIILDYLSGPNIIITVLIRGRPAGQSQRRRRLEGCNLNMEDGATSQGIQAATGC